MTRKDYILLAKAITDTQVRIGMSDTDREHNAQLRGVRRVAAHLADALAADNPRFDAGHFLTACGYGATTMNPSDPALDLRPLPEPDSNEFIRQIARMKTTQEAEGLDLENDLTMNALICRARALVKEPASQHYRVEKNEDGDYGIRALTEQMRLAMRRLHYTDKPQGFFPFSQTRTESEALGAKVAATLTA